MVPQWCHHGAMDLRPFLENIDRQVALSAHAGGEEARAEAQRLVASIDSAIRLTLLDVLSAAAEEITIELAPGSVELRLRGREPEFVVTPPPASPAEASEQVDDTTVPAPVVGPNAEGDEGGTARINLRLPDHLKARVEAAAAREGLSANTWLVRAVAAALERGEPGRQRERHVTTGRQRYKGWAR